MPNFKAIVIGVSAGGMEALSRLLGGLDAGFSLPIIIVQHMAEDSDDYLAEYLNKLSPLEVKEAEEKEKIKSSIVYLAPPGYHLLIDEDDSFSLTLDDKVNHCRPAIDVLFESAVLAYEDKLVGVVLTGANSDGALGLKRIDDAGGLTLVQDPHEAYTDVMPKAALNLVPHAKVFTLNEMADFLNQLDKQV